MLPPVIAQRLKQGAGTIADFCPQATVLFTDMEHFTTLTRQLTPVQLVSLLNQIFSTFDTISERHGCEKIKTIGDAYMCVCGLPVYQREHAVFSCECALEMLSAFTHIMKQHRLTNGLRIGIHSGEVIAGVMGKNRLSYDLWGNTVNLASRMESQGKTNGIQVSESTYQLAHHRFIFSPGKSLHIKGMGQYQTYWLDTEQLQHDKYP